jgi:hypothetical protein
VRFEDEVALRVDFEVAAFPELRGEGVVSIFLV